MRSFAKIVLITIIFTSIAIIAIPYFSCNKDKCKGVSCLNGGVCHGGTCTCTVGYGGANCSVPWRNKFLGSWSQISTGGSPSSAGQFLVTISGAAGGIDSVAILNFGNTFTSPVIAYLTASDTLIIPPQTVGGDLVEGTAIYVSGNNISVYYQTLGISSNVLDTVYAQWK